MVYNMSKRVVIIGGGASGLMAAITAAKKGASVTIVEHKDRVGKKILMTGNGKCNLTNMSDIHGKYYGNDVERIYGIIERLPELFFDRLDCIQKRSVMVVYILFLSRLQVFWMC